MHPIGDKDGEGPNGAFNYTSFVGMLGYLHANSRPDITFTVAQASCFTHNPKQSHEEALMRFGRYLKGTKDKGLILKPVSFNFILMTNVYVDADVAGGWGHKDPLDPTCVKSRTGYIFEVMGCPVVWASKLQSCIATSTMEAEYTVLSIALRMAIPFLDVCRYVVNNFCSNGWSSLITFKTTVHEDNMGALTLAKSSKG